MLKAFIEKIEEMALASTWIEHEGRKFTGCRMHVVRESEPEPLGVHTLAGVLEYAGDDPAESGLFVHVPDYRNARLVGPLHGPEKQRDCLVAAEAYEVKHRFGAWMPLDEFVIYIQSGFVQDETTAAILRVVGNVVQGAEAEYADDGVTQRVTARAGVARREIVDLPNPVTLKPFRTFPDIEQPASLFVLRIKRGEEGKQPTCALFEADGGGWRNQAVENIKAYFTKTGLSAIG